MTWRPPGVILRPRKADGGQMLWSGTGSLLSAPWFVRILGICSFFPFFRRGPALITLLVATVPVTVLGASYGSRSIGRLAALMCLVLGAVAFVAFTSATTELRLPARFLRLLAAACAAAVGALLLVFPFPPAFAVARAAWFTAGFCGFAVLGVGLTGGQAGSRFPGREPDRFSPVAMVLDVLGIAVCVALLLCVALWPRGVAAYWTIVAWLVIFVASFLSPYVFWYLYVPNRPRQSWLLSTVWIGMAFFMLGFALGAGPATPADMAWSCLVIGAGFGIMVWMTIIAPLIVGAFGLPQAVVSWLRGRPQRESMTEG